ncbi:hypothetical protein K502DRAFT_49828 [Neoconidiobolus thromboides FSU 785]|nr:hypothetical protein K502DRAFT_49828 [Neoconidiobolus thromboides FSU 785]
MENISSNSPNYSEKLLIKQPEQARTSWTNSYLDTIKAQPSTIEMNYTTPISNYDDKSQTTRSEKGLENESSSTGHCSSNSLEDSSNKGPCLCFLIPFYDCGGCIGCGECMLCLLTLCGCSC